MNDFRLVHLPYFLYIEKDIQKMGKISKLIFLIRGKIIGFILSNSSDKFFTYFANIFLNFKNKLYIENNLIFVQEDQKRYYFPNLFRALVYLNGFSKIHQLFLESYCIDKIELTSDDIVVDCGANIGELNLALRNSNISVNYIAFEPEESTFLCLELNNLETNSKLYCLGLSDETTKKTFFLDSVGANSSFEDFGKGIKIEVNTTKLDDLNIEKIKLYKMDAEGHELEALRGSEKTLNNTEYVSVDFGNEKGIKQEHTIVSVNNYLFSRGFELCEYSNSRMVGLYKNTKI